MISHLADTSNKKPVLQGNLYGPDERVLANELLTLLKGIGILPLMQKVK